MNGKKLGKQVDKLKDELKVVYMDSILASEKNEFTLKGDYDMGFLMDMFNQILASKKEFKLISEKFVIATPEFEVQEAKKEIDKKSLKFILFKNEICEQKR